MDDSLRVDKKCTKVSKTELKVDWNSLKKTLKTSKWIVNFTNHESTVDRIRWFVKFRLSWSFIEFWKRKYSTTILNLVSCFNIYKGEYFTLDLSPMCTFMSHLIVHEPSVFPSSHPPFTLNFLLDNPCYKG